MDEPPQPDGGAGTSDGIERRSNVRRFYRGNVLAADQLREVQLTAHRGASTSAPENTMPAMEAAVDQMADFAELDVQETRDGVLVLFHDSTRSGSTGRGGRSDRFPGTSCSR